MTLVIHDSELRPVAILDNSKQGTLNYDKAEWMRQLKTGSSVYQFTVYKKTLSGDNPLSHKYDVLNDQAFVSFEHKGKYQLLNIMEIDDDEEQITCYCEDLNLELLNEFCPVFKSEKAMSFEEYLIEFDMINFAKITIGINEVKDKKLSLEWTGTDTKLARLLSIANNFDAEIEFETKLNSNHTFKELTLNIFNEYEEGKSLGVGQDKTDVVLRYQKNISGIKKTTNKREIYNMVTPFGKKTVKGTKVVSNPVTKKVTKVIGTRKSYVGGDLKSQGHVFTKSNVQAIIDYAVQYNILPSGLIVQLYVESFWGNSNVARLDNNWGGITWTGATTRPSGVTVSRGTARPANEGGYYNHYASTADYLKDYTYLLAKQGIYNVVGKKTFSDYVKGLFIVGGAKYNYAAIGYNHYISSMTSVRDLVNKYNGNILNTVDTIWKTPVTPMTGTTVVKRATKTIDVLNQANKLKGQRIGSGQCYALSAWYAMKLNGPGLGGGVTGLRGRIGAGMAASHIGTDYAWGSYQWKLDKAPTTSNLQAGGIYNVRANFGSPFYTGPYGHTGIIKSVTSTQVIVLEQNYAGRMYVVENVYSKGAFVSGLQTVCYPREIKEGLSVTGATTQQISGGTKISYDEVVQEAKVEEYEEEQIVTIDKSIYKEWKDENGKVEFYLKNGAFYAPQSKDRYPSVLTGNETRDNWIRKDMEIDTDSQAMLETIGLKDIKAHAYPEVTYEVDGYVDLDIGDVVRIQDDGFKPPLILTARVIEQVLSDTNPELNKTTFSNFVEKKSEISDNLVNEMLRMYDEATPYNIRLAVTNGTAFKNGLGESLLTPTLEKNGTDYDAIFMYKNEDIIIDMGPSLLIKATDFSHVLNVTVEAYINEELVATAQLSFTDTEDGTDGDTYYPHTAWANSEDGKVDFSTTDSKGRRYKGDYSDTNLNGSTDPTKYKWVLIQGPQGEKGALDEEQVKEISDKIDTKADEEFTIEQLNLIAENQRLLKAENDAKASLEELNTWVSTIKEQLEAQKNGQRISEEALIEASTRVTQIQVKLGEIALVTEAITQYMSYSESGLIIGMKDGTSSVRVTTDRISFYSGGTETAFISQGFLQIESGVFTLRLQIGHYLFEEDANGMLMIGRVI